MVRVVLLINNDYLAQVFAQPARYAFETTNQNAQKLDTPSGDPNATLVQVDLPEDTWHLVQLASTENSLVQVTENPVVPLEG